MPRNCFLAKSPRTDDPISIAVPIRCLHNLYQFTICVSEAELPIKLVLPLYVAVMVCVPDASVEIVNFAAAPLRATLFRSVVPS